ncbi:hypothetical protein HDG34_002532 [Paraburkholderia sp. HC6.4b]|nr:hypothetical protein [Paraburkholderia sp. HC6.4b]MBB5450427.1 hypothetical protein [Paraburkholderia sp. Kb1A]
MKRVFYYMPTLSPPESGGRTEGRRFNARRIYRTQTSDNSEMPGARWWRSAKKGSSRIYVEDGLLARVGQEESYDVSNRMAGVH